MGFASVPEIGKMMLKKVLIIAVIVLVVLVLLVLALSYLVSPLMMGLSKPANPKKAKNLGDKLLESRGKTFVVVVAHPDDAEWYAGGTLATLAQGGNRVIVVLGTSGEKGADVKNLAKLREERQRQAAEIMGYEKVIFLRHPDRGLGESAEFEQEVENIFRQYRPAAVFSFDTEKEGYIYRHADHEAAGRATLAAGRGMPGLKFYLFHSSRPNVVVEFGPVKEKKGKALEILSDYGSRGRWISVLRFLFRRRDGQEPFERFGMVTSYPELGVRYGEVFRVR